MPSSVVGRGTKRGIIWEDTRPLAERAPRRESAPAKQAFLVGFLKSLSKAKRAAHIERLQREGKHAAALQVGLVIAQLDEWGE